MSERELILDQLMILPRVLQSVMIKTRRTYNKNLYNSKLSDVV